ncbi:nicotinate-nucleotide--dimethylbenzimidazole phosphoribosyltransferase [Geopsychrobacter electrodiphilus]|uniref:nicotinate-nucleotide--dimethylbenzimidazole phosphoribosyltransferase n=1 Tax=Geopsychrobacter electrodiphilus TaxID=225196 RepID=UPI00037703A2|nr:nicotinate-nucleotide--dimethylbenzimidazole phosphoribosyltransferase [Geopsychrobacter electrodiphilus]
MSDFNLQAVFARIQPISEEKLKTIQSRIDRQAKPQGSLGRLEELSRRYVAITGREDIRAKRIYTFAGDHGVAAEGVSAFPAEVTPQMVYNFIEGGAAVNALARHAGAEVRVVDMGVNHDFAGLSGLIDRKIAMGTGNIAIGPAMTREQALAALQAGVELAAQAKDDGVDLLGTGDMGIANTTPSSAIVAAFTGLTPFQVTHRGTGIDDAALGKKIKVINRALEINQPDPEDPIDVLAKVGGFEIAGIAGLVLGCAAEGLPVVVDGFISTAGALIASELHPHVRDYIFAAHQSVEIGHRHMLQRIGQQPLLDLNLRLGEGTGGALAMTLIEASLQVLREVRTFDDAGVSAGDDQ